MCGSVNGLSYSIDWSLVPDCLDYNLLVFFFSKFVGYSRTSLRFHIHFRINLSISLEDPAEIFIGIALNLYRSVWGRNLTLFDSSNPSVRYISPLIDVSFNFSQPCFAFFGVAHLSVQLFCVFCQMYP